MKIIAFFLLAISSWAQPQVSVYAFDGEVRLNQNSSVSLTPASCMKIVTTAAALEILGPDARFETHLEYDGLIDEQKTLHGNIYIRGGGDPCLGSGRVEGSLGWRKQLEAWVLAIEVLGIQNIEGKIVPDSTKWERALAAPSWLWEDLGNYYGAGACALSFHENNYSLIFKPGDYIGAQTSLLRTEPPVSFTLYNEVKTGPVGSGDQACVYGSEYASSQCLRGTIPMAVENFTIKGAIPDPASYCAHLLTQALKEKGIAVEENQIAQKKDTFRFHTQLSPPVSEIIYWTNQKSINLYAEHLLKKMGEVVYNEGSTAAGIQAVTTYWKNQGIDLDGFHMADGSGLSRKNLLTSKMLVEILWKMKGSKHFPLFLNSLPEKNEIKGKTGSMSHIKGYAGYARNCAFALLVNGRLN